MPRVAGIDGCRGGWVVVTAPVAGETGELTAECVPTLEHVVAELDSGGLVAAGVDIPIGLPASGPRRCDVEARKIIVPRQNSVFPAPPRSVLGSATYRQAVARSRELAGKALSKQVFNILPKIAEVDSLITPERQQRLFEVHPEVSFRLLAGHEMAFHKANPSGRTERLAALSPVFPDSEALSAGAPMGAKPDDVLDAVAALWSAQRHLAGTALRLGGELDERGLRMEIVA